ncbi:MAG TPA: DUF2807 domain-containing protein, partial [Sphingomicrobium sp.]|nr:DUF2807 domain-containing protein [Sphingomicrobium sp.]
VNLGTHELGSAFVNGSGSIAINKVVGLSFSLVAQGSAAAQIDDAQADQMSVILAGTASAKLAGRVKRLTAIVRGLGVLDASKLVSPEDHLTAEGPATIDAVAAQSAQVDASGPATIRLAGAPSCDLHVSGSTTVSGCK